MPSPRHFVLAALVALAGCDIPTDLSEATGSDCFISCTPATVAPEGYRVMEITPLMGSVTGGSMLIRNLNQGAPEIDGIVLFAFADAGAEGAGARYPMHIHKGSACNGVGVPIVDDLGAPISAQSWVSIPPIAIMREHLMSGYYFDVHAANDPTGAPMGCAIFPW